MDQLATFLEQSTKDREIQEFALRLITGTIDTQKEVDEKLAAIAHNWDIHRMAVVDRNILRMAIFELLYCDDIPPKVTINEAIELGKRFSTMNSGAFINGILDKVKSEVDERKEKEKEGKGPDKSREGEERDGNGPEPGGE